MAIESISTIQGMKGKEINVYGENFDNSQMDQEGFLKVLLTSFQYQDPFETQDISKFIDNTVKLRELEVMKQFEDSVKSLNDNNTLFFNSTNLIDKKVMYKGDETYFKNGKSKIEIVPKSDIQEATLYIYDKSENVVAQKKLNGLEMGKSVSVDFNDANIKDGYYKVVVVGEEKEVDATIYALAKIEGIEKSGADLYALYQNGKIKLNDIARIGG